MAWSAWRSTALDFYRLLALVLSLACWNLAAVAHEQPLEGGTMILATFADPGRLQIPDTAHVL